ncbi:MAG: hypothetical protein MHM6MM_006687 [Cercozoa sp. M6MM]
MVRRRSNVARRFSQSGSSGGNRFARRRNSLAQDKLYKTEVCRTWSETGACPYGTKCQFAHGESDMRPVLVEPNYKSEMCKNILLHGVCPYGVRCRFIHDDDIKVLMPQSVKMVPCHPRPNPNGGLKHLSSKKSGDPEPEVDPIHTRNYTPPRGFRCVFIVKGKHTDLKELVQMEEGSATEKIESEADEDAIKSSDASDQFEHEAHYRWMPNPHPRREGGMTNPTHVSEQTHEASLSQSASNTVSSSVPRHSDSDGKSHSASNQKRTVGGLVIHGELPDAIETGTVEPVRIIPAITAEYHRQTTKQESKRPVSPRMEILKNLSKQELLKLVQQQDFDIRRLRAQLTDTQVRLRAMEVQFGVQAPKEPVFAPTLHQPRWSGPVFTKSGEQPDSPARRKRIMKMFMHHASSTVGTPFFRCLLSREDIARSPGETTP